LTILDCGLDCGIADWIVGLRIDDWDCGLTIGIADQIINSPSAIQSPIRNPQSNPQSAIDDRQSFSLSIIL
jgi:hypothetical protein